MAILNEAQEKFPKNEATAWMTGFQEILYMFSVNESKFNDARKAIAMLAPIKPWESILRYTNETRIQKKNFHFHLSLKFCKSKN